MKEERVVRFLAFFVGSLITIAFSVFFISIMIKIVMYLYNRLSLLHVLSGTVLLACIVGFWVLGEFDKRNKHLDGDKYQ